LNPSYCNHVPLLCSKILGAFCRDPSLPLYATSSFFPHLLNTCIKQTDSVRHGYVRLFSSSSLPVHIRNATSARTMEEMLTDNVPYFRESFDNVYLDLSKESGKCRFAETGFGWKPSGGGDTFTLDHSNIGGAQWSRASKGYEVKILLRNSGIVQLDGFVQEVSASSILYSSNS
jgi:hypothetical protein